MSCPAIMRSTLRAELLSSPNRGGSSAHRATAVFDETQQHACDSEAGTFASRQNANRLMRHRHPRTENRRGCFGSPAPCEVVNPRRAFHTPWAPDPDASLRPAQSTASPRCDLRRAGRDRGFFRPDSHSISVDLPFRSVRRAPILSPRSMCRLKSSKTTEIVVRLPHM